MACQGDTPVRPRRVEQAGRVASGTHSSAGRLLVLRVRGGGRGGKVAHQTFPTVIYATFRCAAYWDVHSENSWTPSTPSCPETPYQTFLIDDIVLERKDMMYKLFIIEGHDL